jgi:hypothetical protein
MHAARPLISLALLAAGLVLSACPKGDDSASSDDILGIGLSPNNPVMQVNETIGFEAKAFYADYTSEVITGEVDWVSSDERVATVNSGGQATALAEGSASIIATYTDGLSAKVELTVSGADISSITLAPSSVDVEVGERVQLVANATFSDGTQGNIAGSCDWTSDQAGVAQVDGAGLVTGMGEGSTSIRASYAGLSIAPASVTVVAEGTQLPDPDLRITAMTATVTGDTVSYELTVQNNGGGYASDFYVDLFLDRSSTPSPGDSYDGFGWVPGLGAGESTPVFVDLYDVDAGSYSSYALADSDSFVDESNEGNNSYGPVSVSVSSGSSGYANLEITEFEAVSDGYYTMWSIEVTNTGGSDSGTFYLDLFVDQWSSPEVGDDGDLWGEVSNLGPGESITWEPELELGPYDHGYYYWNSWTFADSYDQVYESDEDDNIAFVEVWADY